MNKSYEEFFYRRTESGLLVPKTAAERAAQSPATTTALTLTPSRQQLRRQRRLELKQIKKILNRNPRRSLQKQQLPVGDFLRAGKAEGA